MPFSTRTHSTTKLYLVGLSACQETILMTAHTCYPNTTTKLARSEYFLILISQTRCRHLRMCLYLKNLLTVAERTRPPFPNRRLEFSPLSSGVGGDGVEGLRRRASVMFDELRWGHLPGFISNIKALRVRVKGMVTSLPM